MTFAVVQRTWDPDTVPGKGAAGVLRVETLGVFTTQDQAEATAKAVAGNYQAHGYNRRGGYWWGRDEKFRYTFAIEVW